MQIKGGHYSGMNVCMYVQHIDNMDVRTLVLSKGHRLKAVKTSSLGGYMVLPLSISCP